MLHRLFTRRPKLWAEFQDMVRTHFRFLEDQYGAVCHAEHPVVLYQLPSVTVEVYGEFRQFFETGVTFHEVSAPVEGMPAIAPRKVELNALARACGTVEASSPLIHARDEIEDEVTLCAAWTKRYAAALLSGDRRDFDLTWTTRSRWSRLKEDLALNRPVWRSEAYVGRLVQCDGPLRGEPTIYARELVAFEQAGYFRAGGVFLPSERSPIWANASESAEHRPAIERALARRRKRFPMMQPPLPGRGELEALEVCCRASNRGAAFQSLTPRYLKGSMQLREYIQQHWPLGVDWRYPNPRRLACLRREDASPKDRALALLAYIRIVTPDLRACDDVVPLVAMVYNALRWMGEDARELFQQVSELAPRDQGYWLRSFAKRDPIDQTLDACFLKEIRNSDGEREIVSIDDWN